MREIHKFEPPHRSLTRGWIWPHDKNRTLYRIWNSQKEQYGLAYYLSEEAAKKMIR